MSFEGMDAQFASALGNLIRASGGVIGIKSGYRSVERQAQLFAAAVKKYGSPEKARRYVAPPGKSNHNRGVAADLEFKTPEARALAHKLAPQFGLVFPMDYEPWHIEPVGARDGADPAAYKIPTAGALHPQDPNWASENTSYLAASLAAALQAPSEQGALGDALEGEITPGGGQTGQSGQVDAGSGAVAGGDIVDRFLGAVKGHESGGNYKILTGAAKKNPKMTASGGYQITNPTWNGYGGFTRAMDAPPEVQDQKAREMVASYRAQLGDDPRLWSAAWYGGIGYAKALKAGKKSWDEQPNTGLSLGTYADRILKAMG
jgi:hypothetical protein